MALSDLLRSIRSGKAVEHLIPRITEWVTKQEMRPSHRETKVWHPSEMHGVCIRQKAILELINPDIIPAGEPNPWLSRFGRSGTWFHDGYRQDYLGPMGILHGAWRCSRCYHVVHGVMPRTSCPVCQWSGEIDSGKVNLTPAACAKYCTNTEFDPGRNLQSEYHRDAAKVAERGGCLHCGAWGFWQYRELGVRYDIEVRGKIETIAGHIDGILDLSDRRGVGVFDLKTMQPQPFSTLTTIPSKHRDQGMLYLGASKSLHARFPRLVPPEGLKWLLFLYVNRAPQWGGEHEREFYLDFDQAEFDAICQNPIRFREAMEDGELPAFHPECSSVKSKKAKGCSMASVCFSSDTPEHVRQRTHL